MRHDLGDVWTYLQIIARYLSQGDPDLMTTLDGDFVLDEVHTIPPERKKTIFQDLSGFMRDYPEILFSYLYGSFLEDAPFRDVDVAVYFGRTVPSERRFDVCLDLADALSRLAGFPVDVHALNAASPGFRYHATKGMVLWSHDEEKRCDFLERTWMTYFDYQPILMQILADLDSCSKKQAANTGRSRETA
jgi:predicted nucleotidyltransferase